MLLSKFVRGKIRGNRYFTDTKFNVYLGVYGSGDNIYVFERYMNHKHYKGDRPPMRGPLKPNCNEPTSHRSSTGLFADDYIIANAVPFYCASLYAKKI